MRCVLPLPGNCTHRHSLFAYFVFISEGYFSGKQSLTPFLWHLSDTHKNPFIFIELLKCSASSCHLFLFLCRCSASVQLIEGNQPTKKRSRKRAPAAQNVYTFCVNLCENAFWRHGWQMLIGKRERNRDGARCIDFMKSFCATPSSAPSFFQWPIIFQWTSDVTPEIIFIYQFFLNTIIWSHIFP